MSGAENSDPQGHGRMVAASDTDTDLLRRFQAGDSGALEALFARYEEPVFRFLLGVLKDHHAAEDALQETFVQALRNLDAVAADTFRGWLFTIAYRQAMLLKRKAKRVPTQADPLVLLGLVGDGPADQRADTADDARRVRELLTLLPGPQREVILARVIDGKTFREVAAALGCPLNTALARMHDGLKKLRQLWEARYA
ncbi:RNA polymerase sigma factor [Gemmata sp. JC717]|uniref:RNA polymerase sigma factor n=1 Tax=Gemmata algarum TaxID=2975278 RepID=A0ABU5F4Q8_9BACT|nr:RNA polymerase sigma factor [Gemmata algarum]MDY3553598.1 RNA polymerase sigma factor [Gemmata algarum]MDY3562464.1 RNA polymerase sigma factor [Gemmata algarum]